jgi:hypothetical protein
VKDLDKFDMVMQAFEYEEKEKRFGDLVSIWWIFISAPKNIGQNLAANNG